LPKPKFMKTLPVLIALLSLPNALFAGLKWDNTNIEFFPKTSEAEVKGEFHFSNEGKEPVTIQSVTSGCGCTTAVLETWTYQPGEKGRISATFTIGQRVGLQNKAITVRVAGEEQPAILTMAIHIPEQVKFSPPLVFWLAGQPPEPKTIVLSVVQDEPLRVTKIASSEAKLQAALETVREGREYKIVVTPADTAAPAMAILRIESDGPTPDSPKIFQAYAQIKPAVN
jgi:uncharacterized protein DUF1573